MIPRIAPFGSRNARSSVFAQRSQRDRKSTRLNSSHGYISYAVFCLKKKKELNQAAARYGFRCCRRPHICTAPLPPETALPSQMTTSTTSIDCRGLQAAYANLHTDQERDYFMQRYHDVISSFGGKTSYDADIRPLLVMRSFFFLFVRPPPRSPLFPSGPFSG